MSSDDFPSVFICIHLYSSVFICIHLCSSVFICGSNHISTFRIGSKAESQAHTELLSNVQFNEPLQTLRTLSVRERESLYL
jgi:ferredoxin